MLDRTLQPLVKDLKGWGYEDLEVFNRIPSDFIQHMKNISPFLVPLGIDITPNPPFKGALSVFIQEELKGKVVKILEVN